MSYSWEIQILHCPLISLVAFICLLFKKKLKWIITLWGSNKLCAYYNPIKMWTFEVCHLDLILYIIHFLCGMFTRTSSIFPLWLPFGSCLSEVAWCGFSLICIPIYYVRNHLFPFILTMALPVGSNNWNYQQTSL